MDEWICHRCHHKTSTKGNLVSHLKRKKPCSTTYEQTSIEDCLKQLERKTPNKTYTCEQCDASFTTRQAKHKHRTSCKGVVEQLSVVVKQDDIQELKAQNVVLQQQANMLLERLERVEKSVQAKQPSIVNNTQINISVNLNNFGHEDVSHLTPEFLSYCLLNPRKGMASLIETIHYHKDIPNNHNLRCKSLKQNMFEKYVDAEWRTCDASNTLDELIKKGYRIMNAHYTEHFMNDPTIFEDENRQRIYERFRFLSDTTSTDYFAVKRDLRLLVKDKTVYLLASPETDDNVVVLQDL